LITPMVSWIADEGTAEFLALGRMRVDPNWLTGAYDHQPGSRPEAEARKRP
jgi:hypothetical protein